MNEYDIMDLCMCNKLGFLGGRGVTRVKLANVLDKGLRIGGRGHQMNSKVKDSDKKGETWCMLRIS
jgi:hypothetical protein